MYPAAPGEFASVSCGPSVQGIMLVYNLLVAICFLALLYLLFCWSLLREDHEVDEIQIEDPELGIHRIGMVVFDPPTRTQDLPGAGERWSGMRNAECSICLEDFKGGDKRRLIPRCKHVYHRACINGWLRLKRNCPVCRSLVRFPSASSQR